MNQLNSVLLHIYQFNKILSDRPSIRIQRFTTTTITSLNLKKKENPLKSKRPIQVFCRLYTHLPDQK